MQQKLKMIENQIKGREITISCERSTYCYPKAYIQSGDMDGAVFIRIQNDNAVDGVLGEGIMDTILYDITSVETTNVEGNVECWLTTRNGSHNCISFVEEDTSLLKKAFKRMFN